MSIVVKIGEDAQRESEIYACAVTRVSDTDEDIRFCASGALKTEVVTFDDKEILIAEYIPRGSSSITLETNLDDHALFFMLSGQVRVSSGARQVSLADNEFVLLLDTTLVLYTENTDPVKFLVLGFNRHISSRLTQADEQDNLLPITITASISSIINSIIRCEHEGYSKRIFYEAKTLELLLMSTSESNRRQQNRFLSVKSYDLNKIYQARELIEQNIQSPCSLIELAHKVGLNDFKLKRGFKEVMGNTVFGYLYDYRMEKAKVLLENGISVNEVAFEVGYKNPHHFTAAFKKKYGLLPSVLKRQNKGYGD